MKGVKPITSPPCPYHSMLVSFIIPHKGREDLLVQTIQSILGLEDEDEQIEIIIATQNKSLNLSPLKQANPEFQIAILSCPESDTISTLRNKGVRKCSGKYLAFVDADVQLSSNWLNTMLDELRAIQERVVVSSAQQCREEGGVIEKVRVALSNISADSEVKFLPSANLFMTRETFQKVGGFPEDIATCEDYYFTNKISKIGKLYLTSKAYFFHLGEDKNYTELFKKEIWRSQANLKSILKRKITLRELPSIIVPLGQASFFIMLIISIATQNNVLLISSIVLFFFPIIAYASRLYILSKKTIKLNQLLLFYFVYQIARIIGTISGCFQRI